LLPSNAGRASARLAFAPLGAGRIRGLGASLKLAPPKPER